MKDQSFSLQPFPPAMILPYLKISGKITRRSNTLVICHALLGHLAELLISALTDMPSRKNGLREETCFEFFLAVKNSHQYWELNLPVPLKRD